MFNRKELLCKKKFGKIYLGFENRYQASNFGRVKSLNRIVKTGRGGYREVTEHILKPRISNRGYQRIPLRIYPKTYWFDVHRLIAKIFIPNPNNYPIINHRDNNPLNNNVDNLEWCTQSYNVKYAYRYGNAKPTSGCFKKGCIPHNRRKIKQYNKNMQLINSYISIKQASDYTHIARTSINNCLSNRSKTAGGFAWEYAD